MDVGTLMALPARIARRGGWGALLVAWAIVGGGAAWWLTATPPATLREELRVSQFWALELIVGLGLVLAVVEGRRLWRDDLFGQRRRLLAVCLLAFAGAVALPPSTNRIYYDEHIYQSIGQNLADLRLAQVCNDGIIEYGRLDCRFGEYNKQPYAYPHLLSVAYRMVGVSDRVAPVVNIAAHVVTVAAVFLIVWLQWSESWAALLAGMALALTPEQLRWSVTAAVEPTTAMAISLAVLATVQFARTRRTTALFTAVVATAWAIQFRPEAVLIAPVVGLVVWQQARDELAGPRLWWAALACLVLLLVHAGHLAAVRDEGWGAPGARLSFGYVAANWNVNGRFFLADGRFPVLYTVFAFVGAFRRPRAAAPFVLGFLLFFGIQLLFYAGSYDYGADVRYSLLTYPWVAVLAGLGAAPVLSALPSGSRWMAVAAVVAQFSWYTPVVRATTEEAWAARADVAFARASAPGLRGNRYVLTHNPGMFHLWGINAGQMSLVSGNPTFVDYLGTRFAGGVYLHWNFWCNASDAVQRSVCANAAAAHPLEEIAKWDERDNRYRFYRYQVAAPTPVLTPPVAPTP